MSRNSEATVAALYTNVYDEEEMAPLFQHALNLIFAV